MPGRLPATKYASAAKCPKKVDFRFQLVVSFGRKPNSFERKESPMKVLSALTRRTLPVVLVALTFSLASPALVAQSPSPTWSQDDTLRIAKEVQKRLGSLTNLGVFDWLTFGFHGKTVVLKGYASRPTLKSSAANVLKGIAGVGSVDNQIEVLPT